MHTHTRTQPGVEGNARPDKPYASGTWYGPGATGKGLPTYDHAHEDYRGADKSTRNVALTGGARMPLSGLRVGGEGVRDAPGRVRVCARASVRVCMCVGVCGRACGRVHVCARTDGTTERERGRERERERENGATCRRPGSADARAHTRIQGATADAVRALSASSPGAPFLVYVSAADSSAAAALAAAPAEAFVALALAPGSEELACGGEAVVACARAALKALGGSVARVDAVVVAGAAASSAHWAGASALLDEGLCGALGVSDIDEAALAEVRAVAGACAHARTRTHAHTHPRMSLTDR